MIVSNAKYMSTVTLPTEDGSSTAMATKWEVKFKGSLTRPLGTTKIYHVVILRTQQHEGKELKTNISAFVTKTIPAIEDLSKSKLHTDVDRNDQVLRDHLNNPICAFGNDNSVDLGFAIDDEAFEKANSISEGLIGKLGVFLKAHLSAPEKAAPAADPAPAATAPPAAASEGKAPAAAAPPAAASEGKASEGDPAPAAGVPPAAADGKDALEKPKGLIRSGLSALSGRAGALGSYAKTQITCNRVGVLVMVAVPTLLGYYLNSDRDLDTSAFTAL